MNEIEMREKKIEMVRERGREGGRGGEDAAS